MNYEHVTLCFSLPRSRTQWLVWVFGHWLESWHDPLKHVAHPLGLRDMIDNSQAKTLFVADTSALLFHDAIVSSLPGARCVYVVRNPGDVCASLKRQTNYPRTRLITAMHEKLIRVSENARYTSRYEDLDATARSWLPLTVADAIWDRLTRTKIDTPVNQQYVNSVLRNNLNHYQELKT